MGQPLSFLAPAVDGPLQRSELRHLTFVLSTWQVLASLQMMQHLAGVVSGLSAVAAVALSVVRPRWAASVLAVSASVGCAVSWPMTANHLYLGAIAALVLALLIDGEADTELVPRAMLALPLIAFVWAGVLKPIHGQWSEGQALAHLSVIRPDVRASFELFGLPLPPPHLRFEPGAGPFGWSTAPASAAQAVWLLELAPGALLLHRRLAKWAWALLVAVTWGIQLIAHEYLFALLMSTCALVAAPPRARRIGWSLVLVASMVLAASRLGGLTLTPRWFPFESAVGLPRW